MNKAATVAALPRRTAHAMHALVYAGIELNMPVTAAEVCIYDSEAPNIVSTGAALREARERGLAIFTGKYWIATNEALELRSALEERFLRETEES